MRCAFKPARTTLPNCYCFEYSVSSVYFQDKELHPKIAEYQMPAGLIAKYIASEFTRFFLLFLAAFILMIVVGNVFGHLSNLFGEWSRFIALLKKTALLIPQMLEFTIPITVLLATIATYSTLNRTSELLAIRTSGVGSWGLTWPVLAVTILISAFSYLSQSYLHPWMQHHWGESKSSSGLPPLWKVGSNQRIFYFGNRPHAGRLETVTLFHWQPEPYRINERTAIAQGEQQKSSWLFRRINQYLFEKDRLEIVQSEQWRLPENEMPSVPFHEPVSAEHLPLVDLYEEIVKRQQEGQDAVKHWVALFQKTAFPFQLLVMVFLGLTLSASHSRRGMAAESLALSCLLAILFWMLNQISLALGQAGMLHPGIAAWSAVVFFSAATYLLHLRVRS